jgi:hypothetical protein
VWPLQCLAFRVAHVAEIKVFFFASGFVACFCVCERSLSFAVVLHHF